jgi:hypothetical protein
MIQSLIIGCELLLLVFLTSSIAYEHGLTRSRTELKAYKNAYEEHLARLEQVRPSGHEPQE